jgi:hypothetical protein
MPTIHLHRATNPPTPEVVHINPGAVLFVEAAPDLQVGETLVQVYGQTKQSIRVLESLPDVLGMLPDYVSVRRHYHAGAPLDGGSVAHVYPFNVASIVPNTPHEPTFWTITFKDQFELRVMNPLPTNL